MLLTMINVSQKYEDPFYSSILNFNSNKYALVVSKYFAIRLSIIPGKQSIFSVEQIQ